MKTKQTPKTGFTLIEMLVVIAIIALLAAILVPAVNRALVSAGRTRLLSNARGMYTSVFAEVTDVGNILYSANSDLYPVSTSNTTSDAPIKFSNSTDYFVYLVTNEILTVDWNFFAAKGIPSAPGRYIEGESIEFTAENNAWSVVGDLTDSDSGAPFMVTRNLDADQLVEWSDPNAKLPIDDSVYKDDEALVIVRIGAGAEIITKKFLTWKNLNPGKKDNVILDPAL